MQRFRYALQLLLPLLILAATSGVLSAQQAPSAQRAWAAAGIATGASRTVDAGIGLLAQLVYQRQPHQFALRGLVLGDLAGFPDSGGGDGMGEFGLTYGRVALGSSGHLGLSTGLAIVGFDTCPDDDDSCFTLGVPLVADAAVSLEVIGIGVQAFGNLNAKAPYAGLALYIQLGWLP